MKKGEIFWVELPEGLGHAQTGRRPAIIVQGARASKRLPTVLLVPLTSQLDALRFPGTILVEPNRPNGLKNPSVDLVFQMTVIDKKFLGTKLGSGSQAVMEPLWSVFDDIAERN